MHGLKWTGNVGSCSHPFEVCFRVILFDGDEEQDEECRGDSDRARSLSSSFRNMESLPGLPVVPKSCCGFDVAALNNGKGTSQPRSTRRKWTYALDTSMNRKTDLALSTAGPVPTSHNAVLQFGQSALSKDAHSPIPHVELMMKKWKPNTVSIVCAVVQGGLGTMQRIQVKAMQGSRISTEHTQIGKLDAVQHQSKFLR